MAVQSCLKVLFSSLNLNLERGLAHVTVPAKLDEGGLRGSEHLVQFADTFCLPVFFVRRSTLKR